MSPQMQAPEEACEEDGSKKKWVCEYCTYSNWPSSMKCTMCRGNKPARLCGSENIFNAAVNITNNQRGKYIVNVLKIWQCDLYFSSFIASDQTAKDADLI